MADVDKNELLNLTRAAKSWEFTCFFCFKKFASAQALRGHQNAHRMQRFLEKQFSIRHAITHRKRAYLRSLHGGGSSTTDFLLPKEVAEPPRGDFVTNVVSADET